MWAGAWSGASLSFNAVVMALASFYAGAVRIECGRDIALRKAYLATAPIVRRHLGEAVTFSLVEQLDSEIQYAAGKRCPTRARSWNNRPGRDDR